MTMPCCGQIFEELFSGTSVPYSSSCCLPRAWQSVLLPSKAWHGYLTWLYPPNMLEILLRLAQNCLVHPHAEKSPAGGQLSADDTALALFLRTWRRDNVRPHVLAFPGHAGLCLQLEQLDLYSKSPSCLKKDDVICFFPFTSKLSFHLPRSTYLGFSPRFFLPTACLNTAGLEEPPKPNSDISWWSERNTPWKKVLFVSSQRKPSLQALLVGKILLEVIVMFACDNATATSTICCFRRVSSLKPEFFVVQSYKLSPDLVSV